MLSRQPVGFCPPQFVNSATTWPAKKSTGKRLMKHSEKCTHDLDAWKQACLELEKTFPSFCRHCSGWGGFWSSFDPSPSGVALSPGRMYDFDPCDQCEGTCPLCRAPLPDDETVCKACGQERGTSGIPESPECSCWHTELEENDQ